MSTSSWLGRAAAVVVTAGLLAAGTTGTSAAQESTPQRTQESAQKSAQGKAPQRTQERTPERTPGSVQENAPRRVEGPTRATGPGLYIVTLAAKPSAAYGGSLLGLPAARVTNGARFDHTRPEVVAYERHLLDRQERILSRIGDPTVLYQMATAVNGFVAQLNRAQVRTLRAAERVLLVERSSTQQLDTVESPVAASRGVQLGNAATDAGARNATPAGAGRGTVIGVVDSGIWPENPSFARMPGRSSEHANALTGFSGTCARAERWSAQNCNDKILAARYFVKGFGKRNLAQSEILSPRDGSGHGSHTAAVAAGNDEVAVEIEGQDFGTVSGMAPAARISAYKSCWTAPNPDDDGCATADTVAAIDQAVADGVDVLNYSISGPPGTVADSVELAFLNAAAGGVFVAASAGNEGPRRGVVAHASPWVTTVGASTQHTFEGSVRLGNGEVLRGAMVSDQTVRRARLVLGSDVAATNATSQQARVCEIGSLDPAAVDRRIVVCARGVTARVDKSAAVARAGGVAMVLANTRPDTRDADIHSVPTVHLDRSAAREVLAYVASRQDRGRPATASLHPSSSRRDRDPQVAGFSARGPSHVRGDYLMKPDLTAPGVGVVAAVAPLPSSDRLWDLRSGTSTSTAYVSGLAAFVQGEKHRWSPAQVKSAMMTTANALSGRSAPFSQGAGEVASRRILKPGLVYGASSHGWRALLGGQVRVRELNQPSIAVDRFTGRADVTRRVTNVSGRRETYSAKVSGLRGVRSTVTPDAITLAPNASRRFEVRFRAPAQARAQAPPQGPPQAAGRAGSHSSGALTWTGARSGTRTRIPLAVHSHGAVRSHR